MHMTFSLDVPGPGRARGHAAWRLGRMRRNFPAKIVRLVVPYPPGGGVDGLARAFTEPLSRRWGQTVLVENKPGASTMIGGADVARSPADGHTLFFTTDSSITSNPHLFKKMMYDPIKELTGVTQLIDLHQLVLVHPSVTANTLQELVALAKAQPDKLNYGSYGVGSQPHLLFEMCKGNRHQDPAGVVSRHRAGDHRRDRRRRADDPWRRIGGGRAHRKRTAEAARAWPRHAREDVAGHADAEGSRLPRHRSRAHGSDCSRRLARRPRWWRRFPATWRQC